MTPEKQDETLEFCRLNAGKKWSDNEKDISSKIGKVQQNLQ